MRYFELGLFSSRFVILGLLGRLLACFGLLGLVGHTGLVFSGQICGFRILGFQFCELRSGFVFCAAFMLSWGYRLR